MAKSEDNDFFTEDIFEDLEELEDLEEDLTPESPMETVETEDSPETIGIETSTIVRSVPIEDKKNSNDPPQAPRKKTVSPRLSMSMAHKVLISGLLLLLLVSVTAFTYLYVSINRLSTRFSQPTPSPVGHSAVSKEFSRDDVPRYKISIARPATQNGMEETDHIVDSPEVSLPPMQSTKAASADTLNADPSSPIEPDQPSQPVSIPIADIPGAASAFASEEPAPTEPPDEPGKRTPPEKKRSILAKPKPEIMPEVPPPSVQEGSGAEVTDSTIPDLSSLLQENAYLQAAYEFHRHLSPEGRRFTIRLEVDCQKESVRTAFQEGGFNKNLFILPHLIKENSCFVVLWGVYNTKREADDAITGLPSFFRDQSPKPVAVPLSEYL